jgi:predicted nucleic-acid-binding Zn-ribbon protein
LTEPKCPECGNNEFEYRYIFSEGKTNEWKERKIQYKADGRNEQWIDNVKRQFNEPNPCAVVFCIKCGNIIGVAK